MEGRVVVRAFGPFRVDALWWERRVVRDFFYAELEGGALAWIAFEPATRRWSLHGWVD